MTIPFTAFLVAGLLLVYATIAFPRRTMGAVRLVPPTSFTASHAGEAGPRHAARWEVLLSIAIELGSIVLRATLAGRIYEAALVQGGARVR